MKAKRTGGLDFLKSRRFKMGAQICLLYDGFFLLPSCGRNIFVFSLGELSYFEVTSILLLCKTQKCWPTTNAAGQPLR